MYSEKELESWSLIYSVNIWFLPIIFEVSWNGFHQFADMSHLTNMLFIAQKLFCCETENILNIFCHIVFIVRIITTHYVP